MRQPSKIAIHLRKGSCAVHELIVGQCLFIDAFFTLQKEYFLFEESSIIVLGQSYEIRRVIHK